MLGSHLSQSQSVIALLDPVDAANTAAATGAWIAAPAEAEGDLEVTIHVGVVTAGQIVPVIQDATDDQGAGAATVTPTEGGWTTITTSNDPAIMKRTIPVKALRAYYRFLGTITTGPVAVAASARYHPKYSDQKVITTVGS